MPSCRILATPRNSRDIPKPFQVSYSIELQGVKLRRESVEILRVLSTGWWKPEEVATKRGKSPGSQHMTLWRLCNAGLVQDKQVPTARRHAYGHTAVAFTLSDAGRQALADFDALYAE